MRFKIGEKAIYPSHGVTLVEGIEVRDIGGKTMDVYVLSIVSSGAILMVPVESCERAGMRRLFPLQDLPLIFEVLRGEGHIHQKTWNKRSKEFNEKLRKGSVLEIAEVVRDLWTLQDVKDLSYGEKKLLEKARHLLITEICAIRGLENQSTVEQEIDHILMPH